MYRNRDVTSDQRFCPACGRPARPVKPTTLNALLREPRRVPSAASLRVCENAECDTVYFAEDGSAVFAKSDLKVRFGLKEAGSPRPICYCFNHSIEDIEREFEQHGHATVAEQIQAEMKGPGCRCELTNPLGRCCLASVNDVVRRCRLQSGVPLPSETDTPAADCCGDVCCPTQPDSARAGGGAIAAGGSLLAALMSSACCWLPLLLIAFGASAAGVGGFFEQWRRPLVAVAVILLAIGFYQTYRPHPATEAGCCAPGPSRIRQASLWIASVFVLAMVLFPNYIRYVVSPASPADVVSAAEVTLSVPIGGMTCDGCAATLERRLRDVSDVLAVRVSYATGDATIVVGAGNATTRDRMVTAIRQAGFEPGADQIHVVTNLGGVSP